MAEKAIQPKKEGKSEPRLEEELYGKVSYIYIGFREKEKSLR